MLVLSSCALAARVHTITNPDGGSAPVTRVPRGLAHISAIAALGDSVPAGSGCNCTPYPRRTADDVAAATHHPVDAFDDAVPGYRTSDVLWQLQNDDATIADVAKADLVELEIGANDIPFSAACKYDVSCYRSKLPGVGTNIAAIVSRVRALTAGHRVTVVLLDYWDVWLGGKYARALGSAYVATEDAVTRAFDAMVHSVAVDMDVLHVDLATAFRGPSRDRDDTSLLAADGDHPNADGHQRIAKAIITRLSGP